MYQVNMESGTHQHSVWAHPVRKASDLLSDQLGQERKHSRSHKHPCDAPSLPHTGAHWLSPSFLQLACDNHSFRGNQRNGIPGISMAQEITETLACRAAWLLGQAGQTAPPPASGRPASVGGPARVQQQMHFLFCHLQLWHENHQERH